jgi:hypothetical protein
MGLPDAGMTLLPDRASFARSLCFDWHGFCFGY